jgi:hypothetical protein
VGDSVYFHITNLEQDWDVPHGFAVTGALTTPSSSSCRARHGPSSGCRSASASFRSTAPTSARRCIRRCRGTSRVSPRGGAPGHRLQRAEVTAEANLRTTSRIGVAVAALALGDSLRRSDVARGPQGAAVSRGARAPDLDQPDPGCHAERPQQHQRAQSLHRDEGHRARPQFPSCATCRSSSSGWCWAGCWWRRWVGERCCTSILGGFLIVALAGLYDFWRWEYDYGHDLDPTAAIRIPGMSLSAPAHRGQAAAQLPRDIVAGRGRVGGDCRQLRSSPLSR